MDQAPKLPPRPEKKLGTSLASLHGSGAKSFRTRPGQRNLLDMVPPPPTSEASPDMNFTTNHFAFPLPSSSSSSSSPSNSTRTTSLPVLTPVPLSPSRVPSSVFSSFQENVLYSMPQSLSQAEPSAPTLPHKSNGSLLAAPPSTRNAPNSPGKSADSHLIDLNSLNNNQANVAGDIDDEAARRERARQMIKSMVSQPMALGQSVPGTPLMSPLGVPINVPSMSAFAVNQSAGLPRGINFMPNPLYSNHQIVAAALTNGGLTNNTHAFYANLINNNQQLLPQAYANLPGHFATACSTVATSPVHGFYPPPTNYQVDPQYMNEMINKINNNSQTAATTSPALSPKSVLTPTSLFDVRKFETSKSVIDLFDPLAQVEADGSPVRLRITSSPIPPPPPKSEAVAAAVAAAKSDDVTNNNSAARDRADSSDGASQRNSYANANDEPINLLQVEERAVKFGADLQEYCEHLRALYLLVGSKNSALTNSGLVWSARIDISNQYGVYTGDTYMCSPAAKKQQTMSLSSSNSSGYEDSEMSEKSAIFDVRFNCLVQSRLSGKGTTSAELARSDTMWYSKKLTCALDNTVDIIIYNVASSLGGSADIDYENFLLKINGRNEFLVPKTNLSSYVYIQQCKKMNQDVVLELVDQTQPEFWRPFLRSDEDTNFITGDFTPDQLLPKETVTAFIPNNAGQLNRLLEELNCSFALFKSMTNIETVVEERTLFTDMFNIIKSLCGVLSKVMTTRLHRACEAIQSYYKKHICDYGTGSGGVVSFGELSAYFNAAFEELLKSFAEVIHIYSTTFPVNFALCHKHCPKLPTRKEDITKQVESFKLKLDVVCQVPTEWRATYMFYAVRVVIAHGFQVIEFKYTERRQVDNEWRLEFDKEMVFETIIANLPREARVDFHLVGVKTATVGTSKVEVDVLASTFFYLFDRENSDAKHLFRIGVHLVPMTVSRPPLAFTINSYEHLDSVRPTINDSTYLVSHHLHPNAPMLVFSIKQNKPNVQYYYPKVGSKTNQAELGNRTSFDRSSLRLDTRVPLAARSDSVQSNTSVNSASYHDSLYGFYGRSTDRLDRRDRSKIISIVQRNPLEPINESEREVLWNNRDILSEFPSAILKILKAPPQWSHNDVKKVYQLLDSFDYFRMNPDTPGCGSPSALAPSFELGDSNQKLPFCTAIEALQLLGADYADQNVRLKAVRWLKHVSTDELCDFLPQLVQSLRYEPHLDCSLIWLLFDCSLTSSRFCHHFYWLLKSCLGDSNFGARCQFYLNSLLLLCGARVRQMFERQDLLCTKLEKICEEIKQSKESIRQTVLKQRLEAVHEFLESCPISIPLSPSIQVCGLEISQCSYFSSNSLPLKIVFQGAPPYGTSANMIDSISQTRPNLMASIYEQKKQLNKVIFKCGDDLRQDMLVMQIISIINRMWIRANLDLRLITFGVMNNADRTGMIELVSRARTLRQIQGEHGVVGNFKTHTIAEWIKRHNPSEFEYMMACENFIHSCAGYVVLTYLLGICDRHNDNIMVTTSGHLFHIDFGKFLGDAQMMAGFRRDRAPFVFTADMAYVINEGNKQSKNYQFFVDLCCRCFSQVRQNGNFLLSLLSMMIPSGIFGLTPETIKYFHNALMPDLTDSQAQASFYRLIEKALNSYATQFNFFIHTIAQRFSGNSSSQVDSQMYYAVPGTSNGGNMVSASGDSNDGAHNGDCDADLPSLELESSACRFSFSSKRFNRQQEGQITHLEIVDIWKRPAHIDDGREYFYKVKVDRLSLPESIVYRSYKEFVELYEKLTRIFTLVRFFPLSRKRPSSQSTAETCKQELQSFLSQLLSLAHEISHSDLVYTFFHSYHRDQNYLEVEKGPGFISRGRQPGKIKLVINYSEKRLNVLVLFGRNLESERTANPDTYVKLYIMPDPTKATKRKTRICAKNANPTYMESIAYEDVDLEELKTKHLEVSVWANDISGNSRIGGTLVDLSKIDLEKKTEAWYKLYTMGAPQ